VSTNNKFATLGTSGSTAEVAHISAERLLLVVGGRDYHLPHEHFPWFRQAPVEHVLNVKLLHGHHLNWMWIWNWTVWRSQKNILS
jgi:hypothetical protein